MVVVLVVDVLYKSVDISIGSYAKFVKSSSFSSTAIDSELSNMGR